MKKIWRVAAVALSSALLFCGCEKEPEKQTDTVTEKKEETPEETKELAKQAKLDAVSPAAYGNVEGLKVEAGTYFAVIGKTEGTDYWKAVKAGAEAAVKDINEALDYEGADRAKVVYSASPKVDDVDGQVNVLDEELARYPDALGIAVIDTQSCEVQFDLATQNGIPIVTYDSSCSYQGIMANITTNNLEAAKEAAGHMAEAVEEDGQVLILAHDEKSKTGQQRVKGFIDELTANHPGVTVANTYYLDDLDSLKKKMAQERVGEAGETDTINTEAEAITDEEVFAYMLEMNPDIKGIYATNNDSVMKMADALDTTETKERPVLIGFDADSQEVQAMKDGKIDGLIVQNPYAMGYATIVAEARCILELGNEAQVDTGYMWMTPETMEQKEVQRMLYAE